jgi:terminase large subunit-like protein
MTTTPTILEACSDPELFAPWFKDPESSWQAWFAFLKSVFALDMTEADLAVYRECTGRSERPSGGFHEAWLICGRRSGKSYILSLIAVFLATFKDWSQYLSPGERGTIMLIAADRRQARTLFRYISGMFHGVPMLEELIERETQDQIDLITGLTIEIQTANFRTTRGYSVVAALCDELAFWRSEETAASPDTEILASLRPAMATLHGNAMLLCASSPYARRGALWNAWQKHFGKNGDPVLVWQAPTRRMNPLVPQSVIDEAMEADPSSAAAEYGAVFRGDVETFVAREVIEACTVAGRRELPFVANDRYVAFIDPSGGSSDSMTLGIAHRNRWTERVALDVVREVRPPFSPESVVAEFSELLKMFGITRIRGDRYAGEWPRERFRLAGISYEPSPKTKSDLYRELLPLLNSNQVELLDLPRLQSQLISLERRTARGGRDSIDHPPGAHDDLINAAAGAIVLAHEGGARSVMAVSVDLRPKSSNVASRWLA